MQDEVIRIRKPPNRRWGWLEKIKLLFARFSGFIARATGKTRPTQEANRLVSKKRAPLLPGDNGSSTLRIRLRPTNGNGPSLTTDKDPAPPPPRGRAKGLKGRINLDTDVRICNACKQELRDSDPKARCSKNVRHVIHSNCIEIMKHKCPYCGGRISP